MQIRIATLEDLEQIIAIYNQAVARGHCTADTEPLHTTQQEEWFYEHTPEKYPLFVIVGDNEREIRGWCGLSAHRKGCQCC